ncbi:MAG: MgtC/SapB family protein [Planctomycetes bacterium]|nr:MgtC/SapB family protein [Planctomycetota bacterium]
MDPAALPEFPIRDFAIALFIGALVGIEREMTQSGQRGLAGIRTFMLFALVGAVSAWLTRALGTPWVFVSGGVSVAALVVAGYVSQMREPDHAPGLTTEVAAMAVYLLAGAAVLGYPEMAVALGIATSAILAFKRPIHDLVGRIDSDDLFAGIKLLIAAFIVLPLLPDRAIDPWGAVNPWSTGLLVVLISALSLAGYVAVRVLGTARGFAVTGLLGGLVSSTAVTLDFARRSRDDDTAGLDDSIASGVLLAWAVLFPRIGTLVVILHPPLLDSLWLPLAAMCAGVLVVAAWCVRRSGAVHRGAADATAGVAATAHIKNPFRLTAAVKFALLFTGVVLVVALAKTYLPTHGIYAVAALAGTTDVDAISLSMADDARRGGAIGVAATAILIAIVANTLVKAGIAFTVGSPGLRKRVLAGTVASIVAGAIALVLG